MPELELPPYLERLAHASVLLVATDFDGTLAPLVDDPAQAEMLREASVALQMLAQLPQTHVALVSGRALADLAERTRGLPRVHLVGSHGSEFEPGMLGTLNSEAKELLEKLREEIAAHAPRLPGARVEHKPAAVAFHYRNTDPQAAQPILEHLTGHVGQWPGVHLRHGKMVVEFGVISTDKGVALERLRQRLGATAVVFFGDDVTDEDAFAALRGPDVSVKVGPGDTRAAYRVADPAEAACVLAKLAEGRSAWLAGANATPIEQHALLSDQRTAALLDPNGRVVWMCLPRLDSAAMFASLLGGETAGYFDIRPVGAEKATRQRYVGDTFTVQTDWPTFSVTDYLDVSSGRSFQRAGRTDLIRVVQGTGRARIEFAPRLDFGRVPTRLNVAPDGLVVEGALDAVVLRAPGVRWEVREAGHHQTASAVVELGAEPLVLEFRYGTASLAPSMVSERARREATARVWSGWASRLSTTSVAPELVRRSALVLKALTYGPTGAIAAAATTSLPEHLGGVRNWDYRYCWPRDAAMAAASLVRVNAPGPAIKLLDWLLGVIENDGMGGMFAPLYTLTGARLGPEGEIAELSGYRGSRPVRVGNGAAHQIQLDVAGPIVDLVALLAECGAALSSEHWRLVDTLVSAVEQRWHEPDHGIWEVRQTRRHFVHSKVMCWQTVNRGLGVAQYLGRQRRDWEELRSTIATNVLEHGWCRERGAFVGTYDGAHADAATLSIGLSGLLPVDLVERELRSGHIVYRYRTDDGLPGVEGGFLLCTAWLIQAYQRLGRVDEATQMFQEYCALAGPTGLFAEEFDPELRCALGNYPQAYSHVGLIDTALALGSATRPAGSPAD
jgi:trehalose 6-phosphate phosphatase